MKDQDKTREQLVEELAATRQRVADLQGRLQRLEAEENKRQYTEEALRQSKNELQALFDNMSNGFAYHKIVTDEVGKPVDYIFLDLNRAFERYTGLERERIIGKRVTEVHPGIEDMEFDWIGLYGQVALGGEPIQFEQYFEPQGHWYSIVAYAPVRGYFAVTFEDITERVQAEDELRQSEARWRSLTETSPDHILTLDTDLNIQFANFASPGLTVQELIGTPLYTFVEKERQDEIKAILQGVLRTGQDDSYETIYHAPDGSTMHYESRVTPRRLPENGKIIGLTLSARDITARVRAEEQVKASLKEKEVLLRELYHRTKNNMQVISSMLALQALHVQDERVLSIFRDVENRIQSMALVHQKLYQSQNLSRIDLQEYIIDLVGLLMQSYKVPQDKIALAVDIESALVLIDTAIPCGLVLNELLSNVFKHAFPGDRAGEIKLCLHRTQDGALALQVSDNGVGFPEGLDLRKSDTLGLQTVFGIAERQLQGKVAVETERGVTWHIKFREDFYSPRI
jgi:PAS domain S-box-containing protein